MLHIFKENSRFSITKKKKKESTNEPLTTDLYVFAH